MAMSVARARPGGAILAVLLALTVGSVAVALQPAGRRGLAVGVFLVGLLAGLGAASRLPRRRGQRTVMERLNDSAFGAVLLIGSLIVAAALRPWLVALPALLTGLLAGRSLRPAAPRGDEDEGP
jgi:hypothetical protein